MNCSKVAMCIAFSVALSIPHVAMCNTLQENAICVTTTPEGNTWVEDTSDVIIATINNDVIVADEPFTEGDDENTNTDNSLNNNSDTSRDNNSVSKYEAIRLDKDDLDLLRRIVWVEANNQSLEGQKAVVEVIFNRVLSDIYPNTVKGVISQRGEFTSYPMRNYKCVQPTSTQTQAIHEVLAETTDNSVLPNDKYLYFSRGKAKYATNYIKIGAHWFGTAKG